MVRGRYSIKRIAGISAFYFAALYASYPLIRESFDVKEFVVVGFLAFGTSAILATVWNKKIDKSRKDEESIEE